eukprot:359094-Chlamydomonas_euryale.AAC.28
MQGAPSFWFPGNGLCLCRRINNTSLAWPAERRRQHYTVGSAGQRVAQYLGLEAYYQMLSLATQKPATTDYLQLPAEELPEIAANSGSSKDQTVLLLPLEHKPS